MELYKPFKSKAKNKKYSVYVKGKIKRTFLPLSNTSSSKRCKKSTLSSCSIWSSGKHSKCSSLAVFKLGDTTYTKSNRLLYTLPRLHRQFCIHVLLPERGGADKIRKWL